MPSKSVAASQKEKSRSAANRSVAGKASKNHIQAKAIGAVKPPAKGKKNSPANTLLQASGGTGGVAPASVVQGLHGSQGGGRQLPNATSRFMGNAFGADFSGVRMHTDSNAVQMNRSLGANAFTHGNNIYFNAGKYNPGTASGDRLIAHELTHTLQQGAATQGGMVQADFLVEPTTPDREGRELDAPKMAAAIAWNQARHTDAAEISLIRDIIGLSQEPAVIDESFVNAVIEYQAIYGLSRDGKLGPATATQLAREVVAGESLIGGAEGRAALAPATNLKTAIETLINANNRNYADYRDAIRGATMLQQRVVLIDHAMLRSIRGQLSWNNWARCIELLGRRAPTYNQLIRNGAVQAALAAAWTASNPAPRLTNAPATGQHEEGGWVYMNLITGGLIIRRQAAGAAASIDLSAPPNVANSIVVAKFHTHPNLNPPAAAIPAGLPVWRTLPSTGNNGDVGVDQRHGVPDIVVGSHDPNPATFVFMQSGPDRRAHLAGNRGLPAGNVAPQAKSDGSFDEQ